MLLLTWFACRTAELVDFCSDGDTGELCPPCDRDDQCVIGGNPCLSTAVCAHEEAPYGVIAIGCSAALEYDWPPADRCRCVDEACRAE